ncbi:AAA domain-containing protein [Acidobacteriota bacterium]
MTLNNKQKHLNLPTSILNYFAAFTETKFNFRTLINYRWTDNELTLDLGLFQSFQDALLEKVKNGNKSPIVIKINEHTITLPGNELKQRIEKALLNEFSLDYLKSCISQESEKISEQNSGFIASERGVQRTTPDKVLELDKQKQNEQAFRDGCRKYNLALRKQIEIILAELQEKKIQELKEDHGIAQVPSSTFNSANYLKKHFDLLQILARDSKKEEGFFDSVKKYFDENIDDIVVYDLFINLQNYARFNTTGTLYAFFHELCRKSKNDSNESYPIFFIEIDLSTSTKEVTVSFPRDLLLINTPAVNYFKFPSVLTTSRSSLLHSASDNLGEIEVFLQAQYGWSEPFVLESYFKPIIAPKENFPDIHCRIGFQIVRNEDKKLLDYSELMTLLESGGENKFVDFISNYIDGNVENTQDTIDKEFRDRYPIKSPKKYVSENPLNLNDSQKRILLALRNIKNKIIVVDGPPGTGKSHAICALTYWANQENKSVVITSHKKQALDVIDGMLTEKFHNLHPKAKPSIVRISKNGESINTLVNTLQNTVINAAGNRANDYNQQAIEKDMKRVETEIEKKLEKQLARSDEYHQKILDLFEFEKIQDELVSLQVFSEDDISLPRSSSLESIDFKKNDEFINEGNLSNLSDISLNELKFLFKRRNEIPRFLKACEELNLSDGGAFDLEVKISEIPDLFVENINKAAKIFKKNIPISTLQPNNISGAFLKKILGKVPNKKDLKNTIKSLNSLKFAEIIEEISRLKNIPINKINIEIIYSCIPELQAVISIKKYQDIINEFRSAGRNKDKSILEIYKTLSGTKDLLERIDIELLNSLEEFFRFYEQILNKLHISIENLQTLLNINNLSEVDNKIWRWIRLHTLLSKTSEIDPVSQEDFNSFNLIRQKEVEYQNDRRLKNLNNHLGDIAKIKVSFDGGKRLTSVQAHVLLNNVSGIIAEPSLISKYFPMEEDLIDLLVIDEASQVSIANSISLILRAKQVVIFGDEYQYGAVSAFNVSSKYSSSYFREIINAYSEDYNIVPPVEEQKSIIDEVSKEINEDEQEIETVLRPQDDEGTILWLKTFNIRTSTLSFAKAIANYTTSLREHYRSFPEIIDYSNEFFYKPAQIELIVNRIRTKPIGEVLQFIKVETKGNSGPNVNLDEIDAIIEDLNQRIKNGFKGTVGIITSFREQQARLDQVMRQQLNMPDLKRNHKLAIWFVGDVQGEERDIVYYSLVEDKKYGNTDLRNIYPVIDGRADTIRSLKMQRLNVGFSRPKDSLIIVHSMPIEHYSHTRIGDALKHYAEVLEESSKSDFFIEDTAVFDSPTEEALYKLLCNTNFVKEHREHVKIVPQFKIGEYIKTEYSKQIPKYRVDFLLTYSKGGKEKTLILEYDGVEYHTKNPDIVTKHNFSQEYLDYDISRQIELESYGYRFLRINKFNLRPEQKGESSVDVVNRMLEKSLNI